PRLGEVMRSVGGAHDELEREARAQQQGQPGGEGGVAALMRHDRGAVDPHGGAVVDGGEVEEEPLTGGEGDDRQGAPIPTGLEVAALADAAAIGLGREGDQDGVIPDQLARVVPAPVEVEGEVPRAVEAGPAVSVQEGARIAVAAYVAAEARHEAGLPRIVANTSERPKANSIRRACAPSTNTSGSARCERRARLRRWRRAGRAT